MKYKQTYKTTDKFTFGKYKGRTIGKIISIDPTYVKWAVDNVSFFGISNRGKRQLKDSLEYYYEQKYSWIDDELDSEFRMAYDL